MDKKLKFAVDGAVIGGLSFALINSIGQFNDWKKTNQFNWRSLFSSFIKGAGAGAIAGGAIGAICDYLNAKESPIDTSSALLALISQVRLNANDSTYQALRLKSEWLIEILQNRYKNKLKTMPYRFGSTEKGTALAEDFDIDICMSFKPRSFRSTEEMYYQVYHFLTDLKGVNGIIGVREQKKSIGVICLVEGMEQKIDILPQKITKSKRNSTSGYLYVNKTCLFEKASRTKTDIHLLSTIKLSEAQKKILVVLKKWKLKENLPLSSHLLQYLLLKAYYSNKGRVPHEFTQKILMVFTYMRDYIEQIQLSSVENTNNIITNIPPSKKTLIKRACKQVIEDYVYQPNSIVQIIA